MSNVERNEELNKVIVSGKAIKSFLDVLVEDSAISIATGNDNEFKQAIYVGKDCSNKDNPAYKFMVMGNKELVLHLDDINKIKFNDTNVEEVDAIANQD